MNRRDTLTGGAGGTDSALIAASVELLALGAEGYALTNDKESQAFWKLHLARYHDLENEIIDTPATTQGGLLAKAQAANSIVCLDDKKMPLPEDAMLWSICQDIIKGTGGRDVSPDAELIHACDEFSSLCGQIEATYSMEDKVAQEAAADLLRDRREGMWRLACDTPASTLEGLQARGRMMVAWQGAEPEFPHGPWPWAMIYALLRDLTGAGGMPAPQLAELMGEGVA